MDKKMFQQVSQAASELLDMTTSIDSDGALIIENEATAWYYNSSDEKDVMRALEDIRAVAAIEARERG